MEEYDSIDAMWMDALDSTMESPEQDTRIGPSREQCGYSARLTDINYNFVQHKTRNLDPAYAAAEFIWYLSGEQGVSRILPYAPSYVNYTNKGEDGDYAYGAYGERWHRYNQLHALLNELREKPDTRQAILSQWFPTDLNAIRYGIKDDADNMPKDVPCTLTLQFLVRDGRLNLITTMRSNDLWLGFPYDVFCFTSLQRMFADHLKLDYGWYQHQAGSLHVYEKHWDRVNEALSTGVTVKSCEEYWRPQERRFDIVSERLVRIEAWNRENKVATLVSGLRDEGYSGQLMLMAASKWVDVNPKRFVNPGIREAVKRRQK